MKSRIRLLPVMIFFAALTLTLKLGTLWHGVDGIVSPSFAQEAKDADKSRKQGEADSAGKEKKAPGDGEPEITDLAASADDAKTPDRKSGMDSRANSWFDPAVVTDAELQVLQNLSERRKQIEEQERNHEMRKGLLKATEQRIDAKIAELKGIKDTIAGLLKQHQKQTDRKMKSLVKIYENMKPKDAARIFEQLDMAILLEMVERMREAKTAPIMANMNPSKAKAVTAAMARRRSLPKPEKPEAQ